MGKRRRRLTAYLLVLVLLAVASVYFVSHYATAQPNAAYDSLNLSSRFATLSQAHTNLCALPTFVDSLSNGSYLQGSCCSYMNFTSYVEQVNALHNYSGVSAVPKDPYNISVSLAKRLLGYQNLSLTSGQQAVFDSAMQMSQPCCCHCWRWFAFAGQAKYLIVNYNFGAAQIAKVWGLEDGCGGPLDSAGFNPAV
ncbi:MAG: hypothetical protein KGH57_01180 [Candidatus Micrarchaeota archaeon]|nr:hypothetical protein [Candidatus Micrarchaeota archaeon]